RRSSDLWRPVGAETKNPAGAGFFGVTAGWCSEQGPGVGGEQTVLVDIAPIQACVLTDSCVTPGQVQALQRAALDGVAQVGAAFPASVADAGGCIDNATAYITGHETQTGNTHAFEVVVVAGLPGALVLGVEVADLDR